MVIEPPIPQTVLVIQDDDIPASSEQFRTSPAHDQTVSKPTERVVRLIADIFFRGAGDAA